MSPNIRILPIGSVERNNSDEVLLSVWLPRSTTDTLSVEKSLPELEKELRQRWPVTSVRDSRWRRNPASLTQMEVSLIIGLSAPLLKSLGDKLCDEASDWLKKKFRPAKKKRARKSARRRTKKSR